MKKNYNKVSFFSKIINFLFKFSSAKNNYATEDNIKKFIDKYQITKKKYNLYNKLSFYKENFPYMDVYSYNGTINDNNGKFLLYIHGGSFLEEAIKYQLNFAKKIADNTNSTLIVPRYPLIPDGNYKIMYKLINKLYKCLLNKCDNINFLGDSSGGGFILSYAMYLRDKNIPTPKNILMLSPWTDLSMSNSELLNSEKLDNLSSIEGNRYCGLLWAKDTNIKDPRISPMYGDFTNLPKITIMTGSYDILKPDCKKLSNFLDKQGIDHNYIEYKCQGHDFGCYPTKEGNLLIRDISNIINE